MAPAPGLTSADSGAGAEAFINLVGVGEELLEMPLFLTTEVCDSAPLEVTYQSAWEGMPAYWLEVLAKPQPGGDAG